MFTSDTFKEDHTTEMLRMYYKYEDTNFNHLQYMDTNNVLTILLAYFPLPTCADCL